MAFLEAHALLPFELLRVRGQVCAEDDQESQSEAGGLPPARN